MIKIEHLKKIYPNAAPLKDVSVEINDAGVIIPDTGYRHLQKTDRYPKYPDISYHETYGMS